MNFFFREESDERLERGNTPEFSQFFIADPEDQTPWSHSYPAWNEAFVEWEEAFVFDGFHETIEWGFVEDATTVRIGWLIHNTSFDHIGGCSQ